MRAYPVVMDTSRDTAALDMIGDEAVREHFDISRQALAYWRKHGIPDRHRASLALLAKSRGVKGAKVDQGRVKRLSDFNIYAVEDGEGRVRYVGKSSLPAEVRATQHVAARSYVGSWMRGNAWSVRLLEVAPAAAASARERWWIAKMIEDGEPLLNRNHVPGSDRQS